MIYSHFQEQQLGHQRKTRLEHLQTDIKQLLHLKVQLTSHSQKIQCLSAKESF